MGGVFDENAQPTPEFLAQLERAGEPRSRYIIAMTPRSGSSYLCDVMTKTRRFGAPGEFINPSFIPNILKSIPASNGDDYLRWLMIRRKSANGLSGLKASWFQFQKFLPETQDLEYLKGFRFIYLRRRDVVMQAISLYKATETDVFHTNIEHDKSKLSVLAKLEYDFDAIEKWRQHILHQERGWENFFYENRIFPLHVFYEDVEENVLQLMRRIATFVGVMPENVNMPDEASVFRKVRDQRNIEWAQRFARDLARKGERLPKVFGADA